MNLRAGLPAGPSRLAHRPDGLRRDEGLPRDDDHRQAVVADRGPQRSCGERPVRPAGVAVEREQVRGDDPRAVAPITGWPKTEPASAGSMRAATTQWSSSGASARSASAGQPSARKWKRPLAHRDRQPLCARRGVRGGRFAHSQESRHHRAAPLLRLQSPAHRRLQRHQERQIGAQLSIFKPPLK